MKLARDRAVDIAYGVLGEGYSRPFFVQLLNDTGSTGVMARRIVDAIERGIEQDRAEIRKAAGPS